MEGDAEVILGNPRRAVHPPELFCRVKNVANPREFYHSRFAFAGQLNCGVAFGQLHHAVETRLVLQNESDG